MWFLWIIRIHVTTIKINAILLVVNADQRDLKEIKDQWDRRESKEIQDVLVQREIEESQDQWDHRVFPEFLGQEDLEEILDQ